MKYILTLDQGTTSSRAVLMDQNGTIKSIGQKDLRQIFPSPGWVEHDPKEIWSSQVASIEEALNNKKVKAGDIAAIGIANQRETTIVWDRKTGKPIYNAIVWQDRRTSEYCQKLKNDGLEPLFKHKTGLVLDPYFSATKLRWILDHIPGALERARRGELAFGTVDSWLVWNLTSGAKHITDPSNASRTLIFNINKGNWDDELLEIFKIPREMLPEVRSSSEIYGEAVLPIFPSPIPIGGIAGDQQAALIGQACTRPGMAKTTYGTGCFMLMNTGNKPVYSKNNLITTVAYKIGPKMEYALEGSIFIGGAVVQWLKDSLKMIKAFDEIEKLASSVNDSSGVYFVPAFTGLGAPYWDPYARGTILGITRGTTAAHIARAALDGIAFQVTDVLKAMENDAQIQIKELRVDGGAVVNNLLMQFQADLLGVPVVRPQSTELTAIGAAYLAGLAVGFWKDMREVEGHWHADRKFDPQMNHGQILALRTKWDRAVECAQIWEDKFV
jgi:glycerol kinase